MLIAARELAALIPHAGRMCLLDGVLDWTPARIRCSATSHRDPDNPLRRHNRLLSVCGIEYVSQAMAAHGALCQGGKRSKKGVLASIRNFEMTTPRLDLIEAPLTIEAEKMTDEDQRALYDFRIAANERLLMSGRAAVVFDVTIS